MSALWVASEPGNRPHYPDGACEARGCHPLVVIDPEDVEQVARIWRLLPDNLVSIDQLEAALREFASPTPPRPAEPKGRWARVLDDKDREWCRTEWDGGFDWPWQHEALHSHWKDVDAVTVLSEGVS